MISERLEGEPVDLDDLRRLYDNATDHFHLEVPPQYLVPTCLATWKSATAPYGTPPR